MPDLLFFGDNHYLCMLKTMIIMKKLLFFAGVLSLCLLGCEGTAGDEGKDDPDVSGTGTGDLVGTITLYADKDIIMADNSYSSNLTVLLTDKAGVEHDVTSDVEIYCEGSDVPVESPVFRTSEEGEYVFYAVRGFDISNSVSVTALKGVPNLPADSDPDWAEFRHRMLLVQHTGTECPNCPRMMETLKTLSEDEWYAPMYYHVASHSYNESDKAYSSAAVSLSRVLNTRGLYPWLTFNLSTDEGYYLSDIKEGIDVRCQEVADAGICASVSLVGNSVYANVGIKSRVTAKYRVAVWLLEDGIHSPQDNASASWQNMHDNCLRQMYGASRTECIYGKPIGIVEEGQTYDFIAAMDLEQGWKPENCEVMIIVVESGDEYDLVNCTVCPVGGTVEYDYL